MKQHDLLVLLCEVYPHVFTITVSFKERAVYIDANKPDWGKTISYATYKNTSIEKLSAEILSEYTEATATKKVLGNGGASSAYS